MACWEGWGGPLAQYQVTEAQVAEAVQAALQVVRSLGLAYACGGSGGKHLHIGL